MGLGCARSESDDVEWFSIDALPENSDPLEVWTDAASVRVLLCDLDNLRADPLRLAGRMGVAVAIGRSADVTAFAGQAAAVGRCRALLEEFGDEAVSVGTGRDAADLALLDAAADIDGRDVQFVVMSNDGIFAALAARGALTVVSPGVAALSRRLVNAARLVVDLAELEGAPGAERAVA